MSDKFRLPQPIGNETSFSWGPIVAVHSIGPYDIVEHHPAVFKNHIHTGEYDMERSEFHVYVAGRDGNMAATSLDVAMLLVIDLRINRMNSHAAKYACRVLGVPVDE